MLYLNVSELNDEFTTIQHITDTKSEYSCDVLIPLHKITDKRYEFRNKRRRSPRCQSLVSRCFKAKFHGLDLEGPSLALGLESCIENFLHHPQT